MVILQTEKEPLPDYQDETSNCLSKFAEEANAEFDKIGAEALQALEEVVDTVEVNMETQMLEYEESAESIRMVIQENENIVMKFEEQMDNDRNDGLFSKNLRPMAPIVELKTKKEMDKIKDAAKENAGSKTRKKIYLFLMILVTIRIVDSTTSSTIDWRKVAALAIIILSLFSQVIYEQNVSGTNTENKTETETETESK